MTLWNPEYRVTVSNVIVTSATLAGLTISSGRTDIYSQPQAGYCQLQLLETNLSSIDYEINDSITIEVKQTNGSYVYLFGGFITDVGIEVASSGSTALSQRINILATGALARLARNIYNGNISSDKDGNQIYGILSGVLYDIWNEVPANLTWNDIDPTATRSTKTNLILNPNFEVNTTGWSVSNFTQSRITSDFKFGTASNQIVCTTTGTATVLNTRSTTYSIPITVGNTYTATVYMKRTVGTRTGRISFTARNAPNGSSVQTATGASTTISDTDWTRLTLSITITAPTATNLELGIGTAATGSIGDTFLVDGVMVVDGSDPGFYWDGTYTDIPTNRFPILSWTGSSNNSTSTSNAYFDTLGTTTWADVFNTGLGEIDQPGDYDLDSQNNVISDVYSLVGTLATSGLGYIYEDAQGRICYADSTHRSEYWATNGYVYLDGNSATGPGLNIVKKAGDVRNSVTIQYTSSGNSSYTATDYQSTYAYGQLATNIRTYLKNAADATSQANFYLAIRAYPEYALKAITYEIGSPELDDADRDALLNVFMGLPLEIDNLPANMGGGQFQGFVEGWTWRAGYNRLSLTLNLSPLVFSIQSFKWENVSASEDWTTLNPLLTWQNATIVN